MAQRTQSLWYHLTSTGYSKVSCCLALDANTQEVYIQKPIWHLEN